MSQPADFTLEMREQGQVAGLTGDWTAVDMGWANERLEEVLRGTRGIGIDATQVNRCDTSGAYGILKAIELATEPGNITAREEILRLLDMVGQAATAPRTPETDRRPVFELFERAGSSVVELAQDLAELNRFNGRLFGSLVRALRRPREVRWASVFLLMERVGLDAIPIVATTAFFVGAVLGLLGASILSQFGAQVFVVDLIGIAVLREFCVLITAILLAGRSASSFAAEIGSMKMKQEIDAMQVLGVNPFDALVFPRFLALLLSIPLLTFIAAIAGLAGGILVAWVALDLAPALFLQRLLDNVGALHFWVGLSKAPAFAVVIAAIGCRQGLAVGGDVESLGKRVTTAVVQAIFAVILIDALFALLYMQLNI